MGSGHKTLLYGNAILLRHSNSNMVSKKLHIFVQPSWSKFTNKVLLVILQPLSFCSLAIDFESVQYSFPVLGLPLQQLQLRQVGLRRRLARAVGRKAENFKTNQKWQKKVDIYSVQGRPVGGPSILPPSSARRARRSAWGTTRSSSRSPQRDTS